MEPGEVLADWKPDGVTPIYKNSMKEDPGIYRPVILTSVPEKSMLKIMWEKYIKDYIRYFLKAFKGQCSHQERSAQVHRGNLLLANLISFHSQVTCPVDEGKVVDVFFLYFSKAFDTLLEKLFSRFKMYLVDELAEGQSVKGCGEWGHRTVRAQF